MGASQVEFGFCFKCAARAGVPLPMGIEKQVFIPKRPPSQNDFQGYHWRTYYEKFRKEWATLLKLLVGSGQYAEGIRVVSIVAYQKNRRACYDLSNLQGGCKPIIDGLKTLGWFKDDKEEYLIDVYQQKIVGCDGHREVGTLLTIYKQFNETQHGSSSCLRCQEPACFLVTMRGMAYGTGTEAK